jgi:putative ABC transport system substrate-binding protein
MKLKELTMLRREFIGVLGGAALWPLAARAQQPRHIGVLVGLASSANDPIADGFLRPFHDAMQKAGWIEGKNIRIDYRFGGALADLSKTNTSAAELVALRPEAIYTQVVDPVGFGLVDSLGHPGGNVTGFVVWDFSIGGKWMQLLRELVPEVTHIGILYNPDTAPYASSLIASAKAAAGSVQVIECRSHDDNEMEAALSSLSKEPHGGLLVIPEPFTNAHRDQIIAQCARFRLPALNPLVGGVERGGLMSYTFAFDELIRQPISYIDRILKGESPKDLPVQAPTKYELVINLRTAKAMGFDVPAMLLTRADNVIE